MLTACNRVPDTPGIVLGNTQAAVAMDAVDRLREAFNRGCQSIYDEASDALRELLSGEEWLSRCEQIRERLGLWKSFRIQSADASPSFQTHVNGTAVFSNGEYPLRTSWTFEKERARLFRMHLRVGDRSIAIPETVFPSRRRLMDPPQRERRSKSV